MKRLSTLLALGLGLIVSSALQAGPLDWSYKWNVSPLAVPADGGGSISLTNLISGANTGTSSVIATNLVTNSSVLSPSVENFDESSTYTLTMTLTDTTSGLSDTFAFDGHFEGTLSKTSSNIDNFFDSLTSITKTIGANEYTVVIGPYVAPGSPESGGQGSIGAKVFVERKEQPPGDPKDSPEPSTLLLSGLGMSLMGLVYRRKKA